MENQTDKNIKVLIIDNGGELCGKDFEQFCKQCGIARQNTTPYTPQKNGVVERIKRMLMKKARNMLSIVGCSQELWEETINTAIYLVIGLIHKH
jgi:transposase InsO family protein